MRTFEEARAATNYQPAKFATLGSAQALASDAFASLRRCVEAPAVSQLQAHANAWFLFETLPLEGFR